MASSSGLYNVREFGAVGDGRTLDTDALNTAIRRCHDQGGGTVQVSPGIYLTGTIDLLSDVTLHLEAGSVLKGSPDLAHYRVLSRASELRNTTLICAENARRVTLTGRGTIDGNADTFAYYDRADTYRDFDAAVTRQGEDYLKVNDLPDDGPVAHKPRPGILILFLNCRDLLVSDLHVVNAPNWCLHLACCEDALITGVDFKSSLLMPNSDGMDVSLSRNVRISNCNIAAGDDGIAFSPCADGFGTGVTENITVENCVISSRSCAIRIGWGLHAFRNLVFQNIVIRDSNRGIGLFCRYGETIENVLFSNIVIETRLYRGKWWGKGEPIHLSALAEFADNTDERCIRDVHFSNVLIRADHGVVLHAGERSRIESISFENVRIQLRRSTYQESFGGNFDFRPVWDPARRVFAHDIAALHAHGVTQLRLRDISVEWDASLPSFVRHALDLSHVNDVIIDGFRGRQAQLHGPHATDAAIRLRHARHVTIRHATLTRGGTRLDDCVDCDAVEVGGVRLLT